MTGTERRPRRRAPADEQSTLKDAFHKYLSSRKAQGDALRFRKNWGGRLAGAGEPDYTGCAAGRYWAVELKHPGLASAVPSPSQAVILGDIEQAGGKCLVTNRIDEAVEFIDTMLAPLPPVIKVRRSEVQSVLDMMMGYTVKSAEQLRERFERVDVLLRRWLDR